MILQDRRARVPDGTPRGLVTFGQFAAIRKRTTTHMLSYGIMRQNIWWIDHTYHNIHLCDAISFVMTHMMKNHMIYRISLYDNREQLTFRSAVNWPKVTSLRSTFIYATQYFLLHYFMIYRHMIYSISLYDNCEQPTFRSAVNWPKVTSPLEFR